LLPFFNRSIGTKGVSLIPYNWRRNFLDNEFFSSAWALTPGFIIWNVWKERSKRVFKDEKNPPPHLFELTLK